MWYELQKINLKEIQPSTTLSNCILQLYNLWQFPTIRWVIYLDGPHMFLLGCSAMPAGPPVNPLHEIPNAFGRGENIEGWRCRSALFKITYPKAAPGKFPFNIGSFLTTDSIFQKKTYWVCPESGKKCIFFPFSMQVKNHYILRESILNFHKTLKMTLVITSK